MFSTVLIAALVALAGLLWLDIFLAGKKKSRL
jgi:hypothetical protein